MFPVILQLGKLHIPAFHFLFFNFGGSEINMRINSYGFLMAVGLFVGIFVARWRARYENIDANRLTDAVVWAFIFNFIGGRLLFILTNLRAYMADPGRLFRLGEGGFVFYGGLLAAILVFVFFARRYKLPLAKSLDAVAPGIAIGHVFGRLGCFCAGCCHGKIAVGSMFGVTFTDALAAAPRNVPLHPTQLYDAFNALVVFAIVLVLRKYKKFDGQIFLNYLIIYSVGRIIVEMFRGDSIRGFVVGDIISTSQFVGGLLIMVSGVVYYRLNKKAA